MFGQWEPLGRARVFIVLVPRAPLALDSFFRGQDPRKTHFKRGFQVAIPNSDLTLQGFAQLTEKMLLPHDITFEPSSLVSRPAAAVLWERGSRGRTWLCAHPAQLACSCVHVFQLMLVSGI